MYFILFVEKCIFHFFVLQKRMHFGEIWHEKGTFYFKICRSICSLCAFCRTRLQRHDVIATEALRWQTASATRLTIHPFLYKIRPFSFLHPVRFGVFLKTYTPTLKNYSFLMYFAENDPIRIFEKSNTISLREISDLEKVVNMSFLKIPFFFMQLIFSAMGDFREDLVKFSLHEVNVQIVRKVIYFIAS